MSEQELFYGPYLYDLTCKVRKMEIDGYLRGDFSYDSSKVLHNPHISYPESLNLIPSTSNKCHFDFENAKQLFDSYKNLTPFQATDIRIWTYMSHVSHMDYIRTRYPIPENDAKAAAKHIESHWFINNLSARRISDHGIARLWWAAKLTYDQQREDPYELTKELFKMQDFYRTLFGGRLGRSKQFIHAVLEFVKENESLFSDSKEAKVRLLIRKMNYESGYRLLTSLSVEDLKKRFMSYEEEISAAKGRK